MKKTGITLVICDQCEKQEYITIETYAPNWIETTIKYNPMFVEVPKVETNFVTIQQNKQFCSAKCLKEYIIAEEELNNMIKKEQEQDKIDDTVDTTFVKHAIDNLLYIQKNKEKND